MSPTYRLRIGLPGGSQAFAIAERLGLPEALVADARSRLTESQRTFEATLARIRESEGEAAGALDRAREAELRATEALRVADEERRKARRERDEVGRRSRDEAERIVSDLRGELEAARRELERGSLTAPAIDGVLERAEDRVARMPGESEPESESERAAHAPVARAWRVGERARSRSGGWEGRVSALDRAGRRATLETGGMRVSVDLEDLELLDGQEDPTRGGSSERGEAGGGTSVGALRLARARTVPMSLDLRGARVDEALGALGTYLEDASLAGLERVTVIHGLGTGALRDAVRSESAAHPLVTSIRAGEKGEGGDGVTVVTLG